MFSSRSIPDFSSRWWLALILSLQAGILSYLVSQSYFAIDDFINFAQAHEHGLGVRLLSLQIFGHLAPVHRFVDWMIVRSGLSWTFASLLVVLLCCGSTVHLYRLLRRVFVPSATSVALLAGFALTPLWFRSAQWLATGMHQIPAVFFGLWTAERLFAYRDTKRTRDLVAMGVVYLFALGSDQRPILHSGILLALFFLARASRTSVRAGARETLALTKAWAVLCGASLVVGVYFLATTYHAETRPTAAHASVFLGRSLVGGLFTGLFGGIGQPVCSGRPCFEAISPATVAITIVIVALVTATVVRWPRRAPLWLLLGSVYVALMTPVALQRMVVFGTVLGMDYRYHLEILPYVLLCTACVALEFRSDVAAVAAAPVTRVAGLALLAGIMIYTAASAVSASNAVARWPVARVRSFVATLRSDLDRPRALYDRALPDFFALAWIPPFDELSRLAPLLSEHVTFDGGAETLEYVDDQGHVGRGVLDESMLLEPKEGATCFTAASRLLVFEGERSPSYRFPYLEVRTRRGRTSAQAEMVVAQETWMPLPRGVPLRIEPGFVARTPLVRERDGGPLRVQLRFAAGASGCLDSVRVGEPAPARRGEQMR